MKKTVYLSFLVVVLTGCGGGGSVSFANPNGTSDITNTSQPNMTPTAQFDAVASVKYKSNADDPEAMKRILGEDKNNDGIRDDMAEWIEKNAENPDQRKVLRIAAIEFQKIMQLKTREDAMREFNNKGSPTTQCAYSLAFISYHNNIELSLKAMNENVKKTIVLDKIGKNTLERYWRFEEAQNTMHGLIFPSRIKEIEQNPEAYCKEQP